METITEKEFFNRFLKISNELTYAEVRILYLLITEPYILELSQQEIAKRLNTHRRTINIGLKKLRELKYVDDSKDRKKIANIEAEKIDDDIILKVEKETAIKTILTSLKKYYPVNKKNFIINEDFFSYIIGDLRLPKKYRHDKTFISQTIREEFPNISFYFEHDLSSYKDYSHYYVVKTINSAINKAKQNKIYRFKIENILMNLYDNFGINEGDALKIIKKEFPRIRLSRGYISLKQPYGHRVQFQKE